MKTAHQLVDEIALEVRPPKGVAIELHERSGSPNWVAGVSPHGCGARRQIFCEDRGVEEVRPDHRLVRRSQRSRSKVSIRGLAIRAAGAEQRGHLLELSKRVASRGAFTRPLGQASAAPAE
jgi:hypothetical protein